MKCTSNVGWAVGPLFAFMALACSGRTWSLSEGTALDGTANTVARGTVSERLTVDGGDASTCDAAPDGLPDDCFGLTSANLELQVSQNACASNLAENYFKVTNGSGAPVSLSNVSIKYWVNDTSGGTLTPEVWYGGCVTANGTCV